MSTAMDRYLDNRYLEVASTWHAEDSPWKARQVMRVLDVQDRPQPFHVCDIGCGAGGVVAALAEELRRKGVPAVLTGFDIAPKAIERAHRTWRHLANVRFECQDVLGKRRLDFDLCLLMDVLEHLDDPRGFLLDLQERGLVEFVVHLPLERNMLARLRGQNDPRKDPFGHLHFFDTRSALRMFDEAGLDVLRWKYTPVLDLDMRFHRTLNSTLAYVPRKLMLLVQPRLAAQLLGGVSMIALCRSRSTTK